MEDMLSDGRPLELAGYYVRYCIAELRVVNPIGLVEVLNCASTDCGRIFYNTLQRMSWIARCQEIYGFRNTSFLTFSRLMCFLAREANNLRK